MYAVNSEIFVDKSMLIDRISGNIRTANRYLCITRPRRFGKSMNAQMLGAYYTKGIDSGSLFNPRSVAKALSRGGCLNYWTETGPMNEIADCIEHNAMAVREDIVKMVAGIPVEADLQGYSASELYLNTRDEILSAMVVFGFLSYHDGYLRIPNHELMEKYQRVLARDSMGEIKEIVDKDRGCVYNKNEIAKLESLFR